MNLGLLSSSISLDYETETSLIKYEINNNCQNQKVNKPAYNLYYDNQAKYYF